MTAEAASWGQEMAGRERKKGWLAIGNRGKRKHSTCPIRLGLTLHEAATR